MSSGAGLHLERAFARLRLASRRQGRDWIRAGRVSVDGRLERNPWALVAPVSRIALDADEAGPRREDKRHVALHKPRGYLTSRGDRRGRPTVYDLLPAEVRARWLFPVGRLDADSEGLLLFTDDGALCQRLLDPRHEVEKVYLVELNRDPGDEALARLRAGILLDGRPTRPASVTRRPDGLQEIILREGRNRQVRRMFAAVGSRVVRLVRVRIGPVELGDLRPGASRALRPEEVAAFAASG